MVNPFVGNWAYRSFNNDPDLTKAANDLLFGEGTLAIAEASATELSGTIGGPGWSLDLRGSFAYGTPMQVRFQGKGVVGGSDYTVGPGDLVSEVEENLGDTAHSDSTDSDKVNVFDALKHGD